MMILSKKSNIIALISKKRYNYNYEKKEEKIWQTENDTIREF